MSRFVDVATKKSRVVARAIPARKGKKKKEKRSSLGRTVPEQPLPEGENKVVEG